jgi:hypothetical protein
MGLSIVGCAYISPLMEGFSRAYDVFELRRHAIDMTIVDQDLVSHRSFEYCFEKKKSVYRDTQN